MPQAERLLCHNSQPLGDGSVVFGGSFADGVFEVRRNAKVDHRIKFFDFFSRARHVVSPLQKKYEQHSTTLAKIVFVLHNRAIDVREMAVEQANDFYIYVHRRCDTNDIFYVGKGRGKRFCSRTARNAHWKNIVAKHGYVAEKIEQDLSEQVAFELEVFLIAEIGRADRGKGTLVNWTDGGEGCSGMVMPESAKIKLREFAVAQQSNPETRTSHSAESRLKISHSIKTLHANPQFKAKHKASLAGKVKGIAGELNPSKRPEVKEKIALSWIDPILGAKRRQNIIAATNKPEVRKKKSDAAKAVNAREGFLEKKSAYVKDSWANPESRKRRLDALNAVKQQIKEKKAKTILLKQEFCCAFSVRPGRNFSNIVPEQFNDWLSSKEVV